MIKKIIEKIFKKEDPSEVIFIEDTETVREKEFREFKEKINSTYLSQADLLNIYHKFLIYYEDFDDNERSSLENSLIKSFSKHDLSNTQAYNNFLKNTFSFFRMMQFDNNYVVYNLKTHFFKFFKEILETQKHIFERDYFLIELNKSILELSYDLEETAIDIAKSISSIDKVEQSSFYLFFEDIHPLLEKGAVNFFKYLIDDKNVKLKFNWNIYDYFYTLNIYIYNLTDEELEKNKDTIFHVIDFLDKNRKTRISHSAVQVLFDNIRHKDIINYYYKIGFRTEQERLSNIFFMNQKEEYGSFDEFYLKYRPSDALILKNYSSLIMSESILKIIRKIEDTSTIDDLLRIIGINYNKRLSYHIRECLSSCMYEAFLLVMILKEFNFDADTIYSIILEREEFFSNHELESIYYEKEDIKNLLFFYKKERLKTLIIDTIEKTQDHYFKDTIRLLNRIVDYNKECEEHKDLEPIKSLVRKPKTIKELHDFVAKLATQLKQTNFVLKNQDQLLPLEGETEDGLSFKIPTRNYDLIEIGQSLSICVGGGYYADKIQRGKVFIISVFLKGQLSYCIEIDQRNYSIIQAKGIFNGRVPQDHLNIIKEKILAL